MAATHRLDGPALHALLDYKRRQLGISWRELAHRTGCTTGGLFPRLRADSIGMHADSLLSVLAWLGPVDVAEITTENEVYE